MHGATRVPEEQATGVIVAGSTAMDTRQCDCCGNTYDKAFTVHLGGRSYTFDSFECAASVLAPKCARCEVRVLGHGVEQDDRIYCCASCARTAGKHELQDRA